MHRRDALTDYHRKRDFSRTPEPAGERSPEEPDTSLQFVIQKHAARRLHYDLRLELDGVLKSWAIPKGPSLDPEVRSLAVHVEDHPLEYGSFEGTIPKGEYGGGTVMIWDRGAWWPRGDPGKGYEHGRLRFRLEGERLRGGWVLVRMRGRAGDGGRNWLLRKVEDEGARSDADGRVTESHLTSVATGRSMDEIGREAAEAEGAPAAGNEALPSPPPGAPEAPLPEKMAPQLPTLVDRAPDGDRWLHELKFDGYRILARIQDGRVSLLTRRGHDWSDRFPSVAESLGKLGVDDTVVDGEVAVLAADGTTDFQALQNQLTRGRVNRVGFFAFDLPHYRGRDLRNVPLEERKRTLRELLRAREGDPVLRYSDHIVGQGPRVAEHSCRHSLEGIVAKRRDAPYREGRNRDWVKVKCVDRQEFVIGGWTEPSGSRHGFGALLLGWYDGDGRLVYSGRVGTGFTGESLTEIRGLLDEIETKDPPFDAAPRGAAARSVHWSKPALVAEVAFRGWTEEGRLRHPSFQGLRSDKHPEDISRERGASGTAGKQEEKGMGSEKGGGSEKRASRKGSTERRKIDEDKGGTRGKGKVKGRGKGTSAARAGSPDRIAGVRLTNPDRVLYPDQGITKRDLATYYEAVSEWILPHLEGRPLSLVRCPRGHEEKCFYQKNLTEGIPDPVRGIEVDQTDGPALYVAVDDLPGVVTLIQFGVLELHPWGSREDRLDRPDRIVFDLDPGEGVPWTDVKMAARALRALLGKMGLETFLRTTGGKGLHLVAPIARRSGWDEVKGFARGIARTMERADRKRFVSTSSKAKRKGRIYVDYLRNGRGATAIASYSTRALPGAPVSTPLRWDELSGLEGPGFYTVANVPARLGSLRADPWESFLGNRQVLTRRMMEAAEG